MIIDKYYLRPNVGLYGNIELSDAQFIYLYYNETVLFKIN